MQLQTFLTIQSQSQAQKPDYQALACVSSIEVEIKPSLDGPWQHFLFFVLNSTTSKLAVLALGPL